ncbi:MAG: hypothetical protein JAZ13_20015 [Candidatus Thiodiazotropha taylori]|nr:hypothetical protein [Candidatus Thiodiazotropha taylori]
MAENERISKKKCFVIGPIGKEGTDKRNKADILLEYIIKPAIESLDYYVFRADEVDDPGTISDRVILDTINSDLLIADLTSHNANAFYELGIRHSYGKPTIHMISDDEEPPFDVSDQRIINYNLSNPGHHSEARRNLTQQIKATLNDDYIVQNPVTRAKGYESLQITGDSKDVLIAGLLKRVEKLENEQKNINNDLIRNEIRTNIPSHSLGFPNNFQRESDHIDTQPTGFMDTGNTFYQGDGEK